MRWGKEPRARHAGPCRWSGVSIVDLKSIHNLKLDRCVLFGGNFLGLKPGMHRTSLTKCHFYKVGKHNKSSKYIEIKIANWAKRDDRETCFKQWNKMKPQKKK